MTRHPATAWWWLFAFVFLASGAAGIGMVLGDAEEVASEPAVSVDSEGPHPPDDEVSPAEEPAAEEGFAVRDPILVLPSGLHPCRSSDIEFNSGADMGAGFLMFFNRSGRDCGLVDYPVVQGLDDGGVWRTIPVVRSLEPSYTDGPEWTGLFDPRFTAVLSIREQAVDPDSGDCVPSGPGPEAFSATRLLLPDQRDPIPLPNVPLHVRGCRPAILLWAYDSTDM